MSLWPERMVKKSAVDNIANSYLSRLDELNVIAPNLSAILVLSNMLQRKLVRLANHIPSRRASIQSPNHTVEHAITYDMREPGKGRLTAEPGQSRTERRSNKISTNRHTATCAKTS